MSDAVVPLGVLVEVKGVGATVRGNVPIVGQTVRRGTARAQIATDEAVVDESDDAQEKVDRRRDG